MIKLFGSVVWLALRTARRAMLAAVDWLPAECSAEDCGGLAEVGSSLCREHTPPKCDTCGELAAGEVHELQGSRYMGSAYYCRVHMPKDDGGCESAAQA